MLQQIAKKIKQARFDGKIAQNEPLAPYTTFRVGGPADLFIAPASREALETVCAILADHKLSPFILGGGSNILISDTGIRGAVIYTAQLSAQKIEGASLQCDAGLPMSDVSEYAAAHGLQGLQFLYAMPGSVGGAIWMNARCYGSEIVERLDWVESIDHRGVLQRTSPRAEEWSYKRSPFQTNNRIIVTACFRLQTGASPADLREEMEHYRADRTRKGHFIAPSAGSVFKNDRRWGSPTGTIIDRIGLRGLRIGGAAVSPLHANIITNDNGATAAEIRTLIEEVAARVYKSAGVQLEREVIYAGEWS